VMEVGIVPNVGRLIEGVYKEDLSMDQGRL
jgi:hypothetical protein